MTLTNLIQLADEPERAGCPTCHGTGGHENPTFSETDPTTGEFWVDCPDCIGQSKCPVCLGPIEPDDDYTECEECGWNTAGGLSGYLDGPSGPESRPGSFASHSR